MAQTPTTAAGTAERHASEGAAGPSAEGQFGPVGPEELPAALAASCRTLRALLPALTEDAARGASALPGWTRGHVLTHVEGVSLALARQARYARRGALIEVYDGGRPARDAAIEAGHGRSARELTQGVLDALEVAEASWNAVGPDDWARPIGYRNGMLADAALAWWREAEIHAADALLGRTPADWPPRLCAHLADHLAARVPDGVRLTLHATDADWTRTVGTQAAAPVEVSGRLTDLAAWLAGRADGQSLTGGPVPDLDPWP